MTEVRILATSDIHSPEYLEPYIKSLAGVKERPCLFLFAGDIVDRGRVEAARPAFEATQRLGARLVATFGNDEYQEVWDRMRSQYPQVDWVIDGTRVYDCDGTSIAVVGTPGSLDSPTRWQRARIPGIERVYEERVRTVRDLLVKAKAEAKVVILLSHYGLARANLRGEDPSTYNFLYSSKMEKVIREVKPTVAVHGHVHNGQPFSTVEGVPVYNVAFPLNRAPVWISWRRVQLGLEAFIR
ncbi:MAG: metallophosphoesterase family protein [Acidilobus sp.]